jgi:hypothetical protein
MGHTAVMAGRVEPPDALDYFPTPPWAMRALCECVLGIERNRPWPDSVWEPAAGEGHMAEVLREYFLDVHASDVFDYGRSYGVGSFIGQGPDVAMRPTDDLDWIITNPPFNLACEFALRAFEHAGAGVALLVRSVWAESVERYRDLFFTRPPAIIAQFVERVPMVKGRWDPTASTATGYAWFVWRPRPSGLFEAGETQFRWIPPGRRKGLTRTDDGARFAGDPVLNG